MSVLDHVPDTAVLLSAGVTLLVAYVVGAVTYNVYLHPLASFRGPPLAGATVYWKAYVECIANRSFCHYLVDLHAQYGDVVRVGPNEVCTCTTSSRGRCPRPPSPH
jgi:hypothetical protein